MVLGLSVAADIVITYGLLYVFILTVLGIRQTRRQGVPIGSQEALIDVPVDYEADLHGFSFWFLVPALNEEEVIAGTIATLLDDQPGAQVVVVDDGSEDRTAELVESFADTGRVLLCRRTLPEARQGKGEALNAGLALVREKVMDAGLLPSKVVVGVLDADGRMTPNTTSTVAKEFAADPSVGGVQLVVRIRNRESLTLTFQDMEFWAMAGLGQLGRINMGSVSMGGNGQFTRLSALNEVGPRPWSRSLTEDLDLGLSLCALGWRTTSTPWAYVTQQGVADIRRLLRQRTRWYQGHMMAMRRLPELARSRYLPTGRFLELSAYLAVPWFLTLPWSLLQQFILIQLALGHGLPDTLGQHLWGRILGITFFYIVSFSANLFWAFAYWRRARSVPLWKAVLMAHLLVPWSYLAYASAWRALGRIILGRNSWTKTKREAEDDIAEAPVEVNVA
jgi:cellulose synthase/poly-beta-1,6-N-acetylglucosamine synthase-like glycosyltransferase